LALPIGSPPISNRIAGRSLHAQSCGNLDLYWTQVIASLRFFDPPDGTAPILVVVMDVTSRLSLPRLSSFLREAQKIASTRIDLKLTEEIPWN
jgi:hypothetical protein